MNNPTLFMLMLGCKPEGRNTEQHDTLLTIAETFADTESEARVFWPGVDKIHVDAWRTVTKVGNHKISVVPRSSQLSELRLFFLNLGGYREGEFDEFHYKILVVARDKGEAVKFAKETAFFKHTGFAEAPAHIDDKYGVDVDDVHEIKDILPERFTEKYSIDVGTLIFNNEFPEDIIHLGYQKYEKPAK